MEASTRKLIRDYGGTVLGAVIVAFLIRNSIIEAYRIPTPAMRPTLEPGDTVFVAKRPWGVSLLGHTRLDRGQVILFRPDDGNGRDYIKRIVGLPGEVIQIKKGTVSVNNKPIPVTMNSNSNCGIQALPDYAPSPICFEPPQSVDYGPEKVPQGSYFVLGDFRTSAQNDLANKAIAWGMIPSAWIKGEALWVWLSIEPLLPSEVGAAPGRFPKMRLERMFRRIL